MPRFTFRSSMFLISLFIGIDSTGFASERSKYLITSTVDGTQQPSYLILPDGFSAGGEPKPLLVSLHSWSADLEQRYESLEKLANDRGWIYLFPNFRGRNDNPAACGSEIAQQDIVDAVEWAKKKFPVDKQRIYLTGNSGGGHMTMLMVGRHSNIWAAASAWVGISDLAAWHKTHAGRKYGDMMEAACGGVPGASENVDQEYARRSPLTYLGNAIDIPLDIAAGVHDGHKGSVPIRHSIDAFNVIARATNAEAITETEIAQISRPDGRLDNPLASDNVDDESFERAIHLRRHAAKSRVTIFEGGHEGIATATIAWLEKHRRPVHAVNQSVVLVDSVNIGVEDPIVVNLSTPPKNFVADKELGILRHRALTGQVVHSASDDVRGLFETRAVRTPNGDLLLMFPEGNHYAAGGGKVNDMLAYRSHDNGQTWKGPTIAFDIDYSQHGFIPLIPRGTNFIYAFGTQPIPSQYSREKGRQENTPIGYRRSDDDGHTWSDVTLIRPANDPDFLGMSVTRMCETDSGAWLLGSHAADWSRRPLETWQYILRSEDKGKTWNLLPGKRPNGWFAPSLKRMDEGRPIYLGNGNVLFMTRTPTGRIWMARSSDDGKTWTDPIPSSLVHPDAPPMVFHLTDRKTLISLYHNRHIKTQYTGLSGKMDGMKDRSEIWITLSKDGGRSWTEPQFLFANATKPNPAKNGWFNHQVSYMDAVIDNGTIHLFCPHLWNRAIYMSIREEDLASLPTEQQLRQSNGS